MASAEEETPYNTIVPVFCTVEVPTTVIDTFLTRAAEHANEYSFVPRIITTLDASQLAAIKGPSKAPISSFSSPTVGSTPAQVNDIFVKHIMPLEPFTNALFIIIDARSLEDESCLVVSGGEEFDSEDEYSVLRTDFYLAVSFANQAELGVTELGEGMDRSVVWGVDNVTAF